MCRNTASELRDLNIEVVGSIKEAEMQRLVHRELYEEMRRTGNARKWDAHIAEHKSQADEIRQGRVK